MSSVPPPPPGFPDQPQPPGYGQPSTPFGQPTYGQPAPAYGQPAAPPPGYTAYGSPAHGSGRLRSSRGLGTATIILFWVTTAASGLMMALLFNRKSVATDWFDGNAGFTELDDADNAVGGGLAFLYVGLLASVILLCLWSKRAADNAKAVRPDAGVSPGLAAGSWFIPLGNFVVPFLQLRKASRAVGGSFAALTLWQVGFIGWNLAFSGISVTGQRISDPKSEQDLMDAIDLQSVIGLALFVLMVVSAVFAGIAIRKLDKLGSGQVGPTF